MFTKQLIRKASGMLFIVVVTLLAGSATPALASVCTLADHIRSANTSTAVGFCPAGTSHDVITITEDITLEEALPPITGTITIEGGGHTISGDGEFRIFDVDGGKFTIKNLTIRDGKAEKGGAIRIRGGSEVVISHSTLANSSAVNGGAIATSGQQTRLTIDSSSFLGNRAERHAGALDVSGVGTVAIKNSSFQDNGSDYTGGVMAVSISTVRVENSTFYKNSAQIDAGVLQVYSGDISLIHVTMADNFVGETTYTGNTISKQALSPADSRVSLHNSIVVGRGGAADCFGGLDQISGNLSPDGSCAYELSGAPRLGELTGSPAYLPLLDQSPAVDTADPEFCLERDQIGTARPQGGGCDIGAIESTTAAPAPTPAPTICNLPDQIVAANTDRAYKSCPAGNGADTIYMVRDYVLSEPLAVIKTDITIEGNGYTIDGDRRFRIFDVDGGKLTVNNATLTRGRGGTSFGGAVRLQNGGTAIVNDVRFIGNRAGTGGAIGSYSTGQIAVNDSIFVENRASDGGAIGMNGGGFARVSNSSFVGNSAVSGGAIGSFSGGMSVSNSTFIDNWATRNGGAVSVDGFVTGGVPVSLTHVTMLDNRASNKGMSVWITERNGTAIVPRLRNSIIAGARSERTEHCVGRLTQNSGNLIEDGSCAPMLTGDPMFKEVAESATTFSLSAGSPAIDAADSRFCPENDQIGNARPHGRGCDIGAIESTDVSRAQQASATVADAPTPTCTLTTTHALNFRDGPSGKRIGLVPRGTSLAAIAGTPGWFNVEHSGTAGWISADYVVMEGNCA